MTVIDTFVPSARAVLDQNEEKDKVNDAIDKDVLIIGSAFGRTGTSSLQKALHILGYPCYHMRELVKNEDALTLWMPKGKAKMALKERNIENGDKHPWKNTIIEDDYDWNKIFKDRGYHATLDEIANVFYKELMDFYPKYKVIHNVRDPEKWYNSAIQTIMGGHLIVRESWFLNFLIGKKTSQVYWDCMGDAVFDGKLRDKGHVIKRYNEWNEEVVNYVPRDRLLLFDVKKGWEPLCEFLEIDEIPDVPFPHSNEREILTKTMKHMRLMAKIADASLIIIVCGTLFYYYRDSKFMESVRNVAVEQMVSMKGLMH